MVSSNTLITPTIIAKEALMMLENNMVMGNLVHRAYKKEFGKIGTSVTIRKPNKFMATKSASLSYSNIVEPSTTLTVNTQAHVGWSFSSVELTMTIEEYSERYIKPAAMALANQIDYDLCGLYDDVHNEVGTPGSTPSTFGVLGDAQTYLDNEAAPAPRHAVVSPATNWALADGLKGTFAQKPANDIFTRGYLGTVAGLDIHMDQNIRTHTTGAYTTSATPLVDTDSTAGDTTLITDGWNSSASTVKAGDVFTVSTIQSVNPVSGAATGQLKKWVVVNDETSASSHITIDLNFTIRWADAAYKTVSAQPTDGMALTFTGTESTSYRKNLVFHPNAFALVVMPLAMPAGAWGARESYNNMSIRVVKDYNISSDLEIIRLDVLYGMTTLYPELACRITE